MGWFLFRPQWRRLVNGLAVVDGGWMGGLSEWLQGVNVVVDEMPASA